MPIIPFNESQIENHLFNKGYFNLPLLTLTIETPTFFSYLSDKRGNTNSVTLTGVEVQSLFYTSISQ